MVRNSGRKTVKRGVQGWQSAAPGGTARTRGLLPIQTISSSESGSSESENSDYSSDRNSDGSSVSSGSSRSSGTISVDEAWERIANLNVGRSRSSSSESDSDYSSTSRRKRLEATSVARENGDGEEDHRDLTSGSYDDNELNVSAHGSYDGSVVQDPLIANTSDFISAIFDDSHHVGFSKKVQGSRRSCLRKRQPGANISSYSITVTEQDSDLQYDKGRVEGTEEVPQNEIRETSGTTNTNNDDKWDEDDDFCYAFDTEDQISAGLVESAKNEEEKRPGTQDGFEFEQEAGNSQKARFERNGLSLVGITLDVLRSLHKMAGEKSGMTTREIVQKIVKPMTQKHKCSLAEYLQNKDKTVNPDFATKIPRFLRSTSRKGLYGRANVYISHSWDYAFGELIDSLEGYEDDLQRCESASDSLIARKSRYYYWIDCFTSNQWKTLANKTRAPPGYWFEFILPDFIKAVGTHILVVLPWHKPVALTRTWVLGEIVAAFVADIAVQVRFCKERTSLFLDLMWDNYEKCVTVLDNLVIAVEHSVSYSDIARENILEMMDMVLSNERHIQKDCPPETINVVIKKQLQKWLIREAINIYKIREKEIRKERVHLHDQMFTNHALCLRKSFICNAFGCAENLDTTLEIAGLSNKMLECMQHLGRLHTEIGDFEEGEKWYMDTLEESVKILGKRHGFTLTIMGNIAALQQKQGRLEECEKMTRITLAFKQKTLGQLHPSTIANLTNLAMVLRQNKKYDEARQLLHQVLEIHSSQEGNHATLTLQTLEELASISIEMKYYDGAIKLLNRILESNTLKLGKTHKETLTVLETIGEVQATQGNWLAAKETFTRSLAVHLDRYGSHDPSAIHCYKRLAKANEKLELWGEAYDCYEELYRSSVHHLGTDSFGVFVIRDKLLYLGEKTSKFDTKTTITNGQALFEEARKYLSMKDPITTTIANHHADYLYVHGNFVESSKYYRKAYNNRKENLGPSSSYTLISMHGLAISLAKLHQFKESYLLFRELLDLYDSHPEHGPNGDKTIETLQSYIELCKISRDEHGTESGLRRLLRYYQEKRGPSDPKTLDIVHEINCLHHKDAIRP